MKIKAFIEDNLKPLLIGLISIIVAIMLLIVCSVAFGANKARLVRIIDISGSGFVSRNGEQMNANKNIALLSGDVITTADNCTMRIQIDDDKIISVEPNTSLYIDYTKLSGKGDIIVSLTQGAILNQINKPLSKAATFQVKTPNSVVKVKGTVFRVAFNYAEKYMGYSDVMTTDVQNFEGTVALTLYDNNGNASEKEMLLAEKKSAQMITCGQISKFNFLNQEMSLYNLNLQTLGELIKISSRRDIAYSLEEINDAYLKAAQAAETVTSSDTGILWEEATGADEGTVTASAPENTYPEDTDDTTVPLVTESTTVVYGVTTSPEMENNQTVPYDDSTDYTMPTGESWWIITDNQ